MTTQVLREEWTKAERATTGVSDEERDQLRSGYSFGWMLAAVLVNFVGFGYWLAGLAFLTAFCQAALVVVTASILITIYRDWQADRAFWGAIREYLNRHDGRDKYDRW